MYDNPQLISFNGERLDASPKIRNKTRMPALPLLVNTAFEVLPGQLGTKGE